MVCVWPNCFFCCFFCLVSFLRKLAVVLVRVCHQVVGRGYIFFVAHSYYVVLLVIVFNGILLLWQRSVFLTIKYINKYSYTYSYNLNGCLIKYGTH